MPQTANATTHTGQMKVTDWFGQPENLPVEDVTDAEIHASLDQPDQATFDWRMDNYKLWRCGYGAAVRMWRRHFMSTHEEALDLMDKHCKCSHQFETVRTHRDENRYLGTWTAYAVQKCKKCGHEESVQTGYNNWSGD